MTATTHKTEGAYRVDVLVYGESTWATNALRFDTEAEALDYAMDLYSRWTMSDKMRIVASDHPAREAYVAGSEHPKWSTS
jgi:hypothetical protein